MGPKILKRYSGAAIAGGLAHALAWFGLIWLALWPSFYRVVEETVVVGGGASQSTQFTASLIDENGLWVVWLLLVPVAITGLAWFTGIMRGVARTKTRRGLWRGSSWGLALLLLAFCVAGMFSIGLFYIPAAVMLIVATTMNARHATDTLPADW